MPYSGSAQLNTPFEPERQSPRRRQSRGRRRSNSPRETLRPTYRFGEATLESRCVPPAPKVEAVQHRGETLRSSDRAGRTSDQFRVTRGAREEIPVSEQHPGTRSEVLEPFEDFLRRHVGPSDEEQQGMLKVLGYETLDELVDAALPGSVRSLSALDLPPAVSEHQVLDELRRLALGEHDRGADDRARLLRDHHAGCDPSQRAREPGLVHGLYPLPTRDQPGPPGGSPELPDDGDRPDRARHGERLASRREHRGGRSRHPDASPVHLRVAQGGRRCRLPPADDRRAPDSVSHRWGSPST